jgi:hypothetical protein
MGDKAFTELGARTLESVDEVASGIAELDKEVERLADCLASAEKERDEARDMARWLLAAHRDGASIGIPKEARWWWLLHQPPPNW